MSYQDMESGGLLGSADAFSDAAIRRGFIRKVYGILSVQLLVTMAVAGLFFIPSVQGYASQNPWLLAFGFIPVFVCMIVFACCDQVRRKSPGNYICLAIFTLAEGLLMGFVISVYEANEVMMAIGITVILVLALTIFAMQTKIDFTAMAGVLLVGLLCLMLFGLLILFFPNNKVVNIVYASLGAFIFGVYIVFDTQMMMGGKHKYALDPEEYIFASLNLYLDIINLFMYILSIIGNSNN